MSSGVKDAGIVVAAAEECQPNAECGMMNAEFNIRVSGASF
jgi:hypothetical protein